MGPKSKPKPRRRHGWLRYAYIVVGILILFVVVNGALFVLGLSGISIQPAVSVGSNIQVTLNVPNDSFVPIDGRVSTHIYGHITRQLLGSNENPFHLAPSKVSPIVVPIQYTSGPSDQIRVTMDYYVGAYGVVLPFPIRTADVTLPAP